MNVVRITVVYAAATLIFGALLFTTSTVILQNVYLSAASAFLAVFLGLLAVNVILNSKERQMAAIPLLQLILELVVPLHNELFIQLGRDTFGIQKFNSLLNTYAQNQGSPEAFTPEDQEKIYNMIKSREAKLIGIYSRIESTARDVASILGWGYDPKILHAVLSTRSHILSITRLLSLDTHDVAGRRKIIENYFDIENATGAWAHGLADKLGVQIT